MKKKKSNKLHYMFAGLGVVSLVFIWLNIQTKLPTEPKPTVTKIEPEKLEQTIENLLPTTDFAENFSQISLLFYKEENKFEVWVNAANGKQIWIAQGDCKIDDLPIGIYESVEVSIAEKIKIGGKYNLYPETASNEDMIIWDKELWNKYLDTKEIVTAIVLPNDPALDGRLKGCSTCPNKMQEVYSDLDIALINFVKK